MKISVTEKFVENSSFELGGIVDVLRLLLTGSNPLSDGSITKKFQIKFLSFEGNNELVSIRDLPQKLEKLLSADGRELFNLLRINVEVNVEIDGNFNDHNNEVNLSGFVLNWTHQGSNTIPTGGEFNPSQRI